jgi:hypothetical protein
VLLDEYDGWTLIDHSPLYALDDVVFGAQDPDGVAWLVRGESGWSSSAPTAAAITDREDADGAWPAPTRYTARTVTLEGTAIAPSQTAMVAAKDRFNACAATATPTALRVAERHLTRRALVQRNGTAAVADRGPLAFEFGMQLSATDPLRYDDAEATVSTDLSNVSAAGRTYPRLYPLVYAPGTDATHGLLTVANAGNASTGGTLRIFGPVTNPLVTHLPTGRQLKLGLTIANSSVVEINLDDHTVVLDGSVSRRSFLSPAQWWRHAPGLTRLSFSGTAPTTPSPPAIPFPRMDLSFRSAWR